MKSISETMTNMRWRSPAGVPSLDKIKEDLFHNPLVEELRREHPEISLEILDRSLVKLDQAVQEKKNCESCLSLDQCPNLVKGHQAKLNWSGTYLETIFTACPKWIQRQEQVQRENLIKSHYIPKDVLSASFQGFVQDTKRFDAFRALMEFCLKTEPGSKERKMKGLYLYGPLGVGKSYLMAATARKLADRGISSLMVYSPDFFREVKDSLQDNSLQDKIDVLKALNPLVSSCASRTRSMCSTRSS